MGIPTPTYYDQLLITKCKLLLQSALANPKRRGGSYSYEEFVTGLDERDEGTIRTFEVLLQETAIRRPRKINTNPDAAVETASGSSNSRRRPRTVSSTRGTGTGTGTGGGGIQRQRQLGEIFFGGDNDLSSDSSDSGFEIEEFDEEEEEEEEEENDNRDERGANGNGEQIVERAMQTARQARRILLDMSERGSRPVGIPIDRTITTTTTTTRPRGEAGGTGGRNDRDLQAGNPSDLLREHERGSLFGFEEPAPSFSELLNNIASQDPSSSSLSTSRSRLSPNPNPDTSSRTTTTTNHNFSELPTFQELWNVVTAANHDDDDEPFPSESINSFESFLNRLNSTRAVSALSPTSLLHASDMNGLLAELTLRDVSIPIRVRNAIARRRINNNVRPLRRRNNLVTTAATTTTAASNDSPLMEGIWRIQAGPAEPMPEIGDELDDDRERRRDSRNHGTFSDFARRRRALTREREEQGGGGSSVANLVSGGGDGGRNVTSSSMLVENSLSSSSSNSTAATSQAPSPVATCPQGGPVAAISSSSSSLSSVHRPLSSADRAIALMRNRREILPLPSPSSTTASTSNLDREERELQSARETWIDRMISRGLGIIEHGASDQR